MDLGTIIVLSLIIFAIWTIGSKVERLEGRREEDKKVLLRMFKYFDRRLDELEERK